MTTAKKHLLTGAANQVLVSGTSFIVSAYLAYRIPAADFAIYALAISLSVLLSSTINSLITTPMVIDARGSDSKLRDNYVIHGIKTAFLFLALIATCAWLIKAILPAPITTTEFSSIAIFSLSYSAKEFISRTAIAIDKIRPLVTTNAIYFIGVAVLLAILDTNEFLTIDNSLHAISAINLLAATILLIGLGFQKSSWPKSTDTMTSNVSVQQRAWALLGSSLIWAQTQGFTPIIMLLFGKEIAGSIAASRLVLTPALTILSGTSQFLLPKIAEQERTPSTTSHFNLDRIYSRLCQIAIAYAACSIVVLYLTRDVEWVKKFPDFAIFAAIWSLIAITQTLRDKSSLRLIAMGKFREITIYTALAMLPLALSSVICIQYKYPSLIIIGIVIGEVVLAVLLKRGLKSSHK